MRTPKETKFLDTGIDERRQVIRKLKTSMAGHEVKVEGESNSSNFSDSNEEGEVEPSEDELINVRYSESDTSIRTPKPGPSKDELKGDSNSGPDNQMKSWQLTKKEQRLIRDPKPGQSGVRKCGPTATPTKSKSKEPKKFISPIKFPEKTPIKINEEVPLSKLTPRIIKPPAILDLRENLNVKPASSEPKIDSGRGPMKFRVNCDFPPRLNNDKPNVPAFLPWKPGHTPTNNPWLPATSSHMKWGTAHSSRSFIVGKTTSRNNSTMTVQEDEAPGIDGDVEEEEEEEDGFNDPRGEDEKINK